MTFDEYKSAVDYQLSTIAGVVSDDLMDWDYWEAFMDGQGPRECALDVLEDNGFVV
jgi:hypothetical protein